MPAVFGATLIKLAFYSTYKKDFTKHHVQLRMIGYNFIAKSSRHEPHLFSQPRKSLAPSSSIISPKKKEARQGLGCAACSQITTHSVISSSSQREEGERERRAIYII